MSVTWKLRRFEESPMDCQKDTRNCSMDHVDRKTECFDNHKSSLDRQPGILDIWMDDKGYIRCLFYDYCSSVAVIPTTPRVYIV